MKKQGVLLMALVVLALSWECMSYPKYLYEHPDQLSPEEIEALRPELRYLRNEKGEPTSVSFYSGYLPINGSLDNALFYIFYPSFNNPAADPVALWLNGGPGASSMIGCFMENGPYSIGGTKDNYTLTVNPYTWTNNASVIFLDNPVGTGFSYFNSTSNIPTNEPQLANDLYSAFQAFFTAFPEYQQNDFFITGESYAGKYIPSFATAIYNNNNNLPEGAININLVGLAIGDGWVHPPTQNQAYVDYPYNLGLIDDFQKNEAQSIANDLLNHILSENWVKANELSNQLEDYVVSKAGTDEDNVLYDYDPIQRLAGALTAYLNNEKSQFNVGNHTWLLESNVVDNAFNNDEQQSVLYLLPNLIANYRVMLYIGNMDLNCNLVGIEAYIAEMEWPDYKKFYNTQQRHWRANGGLAGYHKGVGNFSTVIVRNAGHEVPYFQPQNALTMFNNFVFDLPF